MSATDEYSEVTVDLVFDEKVLIILDGFGEQDGYLLGRSKAPLVCSEASTCSACTQCSGGQECADELGACLDDPECSALAICIDQCADDEMCITQCKDDHPDGGALYGAFLDCSVCTTCTDVCAGAVPWHGCP